MLTIAPENVWTTVYYDDRGASPLKNVLNHGLRVDVPGAEFTWDYKSGAWDGKTQLWEDRHDMGAVRIRTGLMQRLIAHLDAGGIPWQRGVDHRNVPGDTVLQPTQVKLRPYQHEALKVALEHVQPQFGWWPRGVQQIATGGGKTELAVAMYEMNPVPTFFLVHRKDLLLQAKERFERYGHEVGIIGSGKFDPVPGINIATMQTLRATFANPTSGKAMLLWALIEDCQQVFFDECHLMASSLDKGNEFVDVADKFDVPFRWGLTATPFMRTAYDNLLLEGVTGPSLFQITTKELIELGYLTRPKVVMKKVPGNLLVTSDWKSSRSNKAKAEYWRRVEEKGIKFNDARTDLVVDEIVNGPYPALVLVKTVEQAKFIEGKFRLREGASPLHDVTRFKFLSGKTSAKLRREAVAEMQAGTLDVICATTIFDEGVDIPELRKVVLAGGGKSQVKLIQRVGRALRIADGKETATIIDFDDEHHSMLKRHAKERRKVYKEQEFEVVDEEI